MSPASAPRGRPRKDICSPCPGFVHYRAGQDHEALAAAENAARLFPDKGARTAFWIACLNCRIGNPDEALRVLQAARQEGHWWGEATFRDSDLDPLRGRPQFQALIEECRQVQQAAQARAKPTVLTFLPQGFPPPYPLLLAFHAHLSKAEECAGHFQAVLELGWAVAALQGTQLEGEEAYVWLDCARAEREIAGLFEGICREHPVDAGQVVLAGISAGGGQAIRLALQGGPVPSRGFLALIPGMVDHASWVPLVAQAARRGLRGSMLTGEEDHHRPTVLELQKRLVQEGIPCELEIVPGLGHEVPQDLRERLRRGLNFVLGR